MDSVLTLIGAPASSPLSEPLAEAAQTTLVEAGARAADIDWLAPGLACDVPFAGITAETAERAVRERLSGAPLDVAAQPSRGRRKALLVADMESTIIAEEMLDELADAIGLRGRIAAITARAMAGELDFEDALRARVELLAGRPEADLEEAGARMTLDPGARTLVQTMRRNGAYTVLVSGGFTHFSAAVRELCGFHEDRANRLLLEDGHLLGTVAEPILGRAAKLQTLEQIAAARTVPLSAACAVGDGANDADMLRRAGLGVAYRAKPFAREAARVRIDHGDLTALLYLQGYRKSEFVE